MSVNIIYHKVWEGVKRNINYLGGIEIFAQAECVRCSKRCRQNLVANFNGVFGPVGVRVLPLGFAGRK